VHLLAEKLDIPLLIPEKCNEADFLEKLRSLSPDLCITAAYGNYLPKAFLTIPKHGTLNIHPSKLPKYRGASPVQRALENGDNEIGISILITVQKMDAGPIVRQIQYPLNGNEKADEVLENTFLLGVKELISLLPSVWKKNMTTIIQNENEATVAPKLTVEEARVDFSHNSATQIHNKCRGFAEWPGIWSMFSIEDQQPQKIKIITTRVIESKPETIPIENREKDVKIVKIDGINMFRVICGDGSVLGIVELQPQSRNIMRAKDFQNGMRGQSLRWNPCPALVND